MRGCGKVLVDGCWMLSAGCETIFFSPTLTSTTLSHRGGKLFGGNCSLLVVTSALKSQRRVRCEFGVVCFLEIGCLLREIN